MRGNLVKKGTAWFLRIIALFLLVLIAFASFALFEESYEKKKVESEIEKLRKEAQKIEKDNSQIREKIAYLESREFREKEARDKLNLQGEGENLVIVKPSLSQEKSSEESPVTGESENNSPRKEDSNFEKWWKYFFEY